MNEKKAENIYNLALKHFRKKLGKDVTYQNELHNVGKEYFGHKFSGVFPRDKLIVTPNQPYAIMNLDPTGMPGSHWVSVILNKKNKKIIYDSFGRRIKGGEIYPDDDAEQKVKENDCGARAVCFLWLYDQFGEKASLMI